MSEPRLDERVHKSLQILARKGGDLLRAERDLIGSTIKDLAVLANGEVGPVAFHNNEKDCGKVLPDAVEQVHGFPNGGTILS